MEDSNPNDRIRGEILQCLYQRHQKSRSPKTAAVKISDLCADMKEEYGYKQNQVSSNLDYLVQEGYVVEKHQERSFQASSGAKYSSESITYKISSAGINRIEKASLYKAPPLTNTVNVGNVHGVLVVGDNNVVNSTYMEAANALTELRKHVEEDAQASSDEKVSALSDIDSMLTQMQKPKPNVTILKALWNSAKALATVNGAATLIQHADHIFKGLGW